MPTALHSNLSSTPGKKTSVLLLMPLTPSVRYSASLRSPYFIAYHAYYTPAHFYEPVKSDGEPLVLVPHSTLEVLSCSANCNKFATRHQRFPSLASDICLMWKWRHWPGSLVRQNAASHLSYISNPADEAFRKWNGGKNKQEAFSEIAQPWSMLC